MFAGYLAFRDSATKERKRAFFMLLFSTLLMVVNARWRRFAEYFPPFAVLFAAFAVEPLIRSARERFAARAPATSNPETVEETDAAAADAAAATNAAPRPAPARVERARA